jgi:hypothetical protein
MQTSLPAKGGKENKPLTQLLHHFINMALADEEEKKYGRNGNNGSGGQGHGEP